MGRRRDLQVVTLRRRNKVCLSTVVACQYVLYHVSCQGSRYFEWVFHSPPPTITPNCCNPIPPLLSGRAGGWVGRSINSSNGDATWLLSILRRCYALSLPYAPDDRLWQARQIFCCCCLAILFFFVSRNDRQKVRLVKSESLPRLHKHHFPTWSYILSIIFSRRAVLRCFLFVSRVLGWTEVPGKKKDR